MLDRNFEGKHQLYCSNFIYIGRDAFTTVVYNPTPRTESFYVRLPVVDSVEYTIKDTADTENNGENLRSSTSS